MIKRKIAVALSIGAICTGLLTACTRTYVEPQAEIGWSGTERIVRVTDNSGQQFLINYFLYQQLFSAGGYNNVVHHYYSNPSGRGFYQANTRFTRPTRLSNFTASYRTTVTHHKVYTPSSTYVNRSRRSATYVRASRIYSSKPSSSFFRSSSKPSYSRSSWSSPSRSSYRSSFRSSFRSGRR